MIRNYLKIFFRKQPIYTAINLGGLVLGMTAALLLFRYVRYEQTYDTQVPNSKNIWRVFNQTLSGNSVITQDANTHSAIGPTLKTDVNGVLDYARLYCGDTPEITVLAENQPFEIKRYFATDQGFLRMFPQKIIAGNEKNCLESPYSAIITKSQAKRVFGTENVLGKNLKIQNGMLAGNYTITAVIEDVPENTHLKFEMLVSYKTRYAMGHQDNFESYWDYTYFQLASNNDTKNVRARLEKINEQFLKKESIRLDIQPFNDIHLHSNLTYELEPNGNARIVQFFIVIALLILIIAFVNYISLTTALANERGKEVGIKKALGASKAMLVKQFLFESIFLNCIAFLVSVLLLHLCIEPFGHFIGRPLIAPNMPLDYVFWSCSIGILLLLSFFTGIYPAILLSGFQPLEVLRGKFSFGSAVMLRKSLVVFQFACSVALIIGVIVVYKQLNFLKKHDLGVKLDQIVAIKSSIVQNDSLSKHKLGLLKAECSKILGIKGIASSSVVPSLGVNTISGSSRPIHWVKKPDFSKITSYFVETDEDFFNLLDIKILAGKHQFFHDRAARFSTVTINQAMLKALGFPNAHSAIGEKIAYQNSENGASMTIGGVIEDFHVESLKTPPQPTLYYCFSPEQLNYLSIKIEPNQIPKTLAAIESSWKKIYPEKPFRYWFLDQNFQNQYNTEVQFGKTFGLFSTLAFMISCLGLLGLVAYNVRLRQKEIGIRKVLGASILSITFLLSKDFLKLILVAIIIASPLAYFFMQKWLQDFEYRIVVSWWIFPLAGFFAIIIAFLTVGYQSVKSARMNPVKSLKSE